jgi:glycosyltransferase involved in cell wall biosynthesis
MAYGLPIVATRIQANVDVLGEENAPWLFEVGAAHELADRLLSLQLSPNLRTQLGTANRTKALLRFSNNHYIEEVDALLAS